MNELALFAGAGGGILGGVLLGWRTVCAVELDPYARAVLLARQADGCLEPFPIWDDVRTFDGRPWRGHIDIVTGGFPCQDISAAGRGAGITGERSGLWGEMARIIGEVRPRFAFVENSPMLTSRGLGTVLGDLAALGYDARWGVLGAIDAGAPHKRERIWIVADAKEKSRWEQPKDVANGTGRESRSISESGYTHAGLLADANGSLRDRRAEEPRRETQGRTPAIGNGWWQSEPDVGRVAHGIPARVDRLRCLGNAQVPAVEALSWETLTDLIGDATEMIPE